jgi:hypothetical protein
MFGPIILIRAKKLKFKRTRPVFVEPKQWQLLLGWLVYASLLVGAVAAVWSVRPIGNWLDRTLDADGFLSGLTMTPLILIVLFGPFVLYTAYIYLRYEEIVEYRTDEWNRIQSRKQGRKSNGWALFK